MNQVQASRCWSILRGSAGLVFVLTAIAAVLASSPVSNSQNPTGSGVSEYFVSADAGGDGDGSRRRPFASLSQAESAAAAGDVIYVIASTEGRILNGGIALKAGQKLLGIDSNGQLLENPHSRTRLSNTTDKLDGVMVKLSSDNEVAGLHFMNMRGHAISAANTNYSGTYIHHTSYSGNAQEHTEDERGLVYAISLNASEGILDGIRIEDSSFYDGEDLGAIRVFQSGSSRGSYRFQRNDFSNLGGRAYFVRTRNSSFVETIILDSSADNIGRGNRNSDSIIPYLMGQSEQVMLIRNYHFNNSNQVGNQSNTAIEAFMFGQPRADEANWCTRCRLTLKILDSVIENSVTDSIQFSNSGRNSELSFEIRNNKIIGGNPQQGGGAISLNLQGVPDSGGSTRLLVENNDIIGSTGYGFAMNNRGGGDGHVAIIDFGGGVLGSLGGNRFIGNDRGEMRVLETRITAQGNWWGGDEPRIYNSDNQLFQNSKVEFEPLLLSDPRPVD